MLAVDPNGAPAYVKIDHTTGYVLVSVTTAVDVAPASVPAVAYHDSNGVRSMTGTNSGTGTTVRALLTDNSHPGYLWISG